MVADFSEKLLSWFDQHGRKNLPWQKDITPYRTWVSEIMLQQTQVATVIPYYERFMQRFAAVGTLAGATEDEVLHLWTGLGYYARARNLHKTARIITDEFDAVFPATLDALSGLPGIGRSTAGAIMAIAYQKRATILDGNVKRVLARCFGIAGWPGQNGVGQRLWQQADTLTPACRIADYTQAIMDLGATLCTRIRPVCEECPLSDGCIAYQENKIASLPGKKPKKIKPEKTTCMLLLQNDAGEWLLRKRPNSGIWGGLWSFPECDSSEIQNSLLDIGVSGASSQVLAPFRHSFTHFHLDITPILVELDQAQSSKLDERVSESNEQLWFNQNNPREIGLTRPVTKLLAQLSETKAHA